MGISRRPSGSCPSSGAEGPPVPSSWSLQFPVLWSFMTEAQFSDGLPRQLPTLLLFVEGPLLKACLNDRAEGVRAFVSGASLEALIGSLEAGLTSGGLEWRADKRPSARR